MGDILNAYKAAISAGDKSVNAIKNEDHGAVFEATRDGLLALGSIASLLSQNPWLKGTNALGSLYSLKQAANEAYNANNAAEALRAVAGALAAAGSLISAFPPPQTKVIGAVMAITFTLVKRGIDAYIVNDNVDALRSPTESLPQLPPDFFDQPSSESDVLYTGIDNQCNSYTTSALNWVAPRRDPLVLDLDGGGIRTSAIDPNAPIYFDQDSDGTLTATGWIAAGEAIVVRDLNGNGLIDSGRELFGDSTVLTHGPNAGQLAANGFEALADLDADASGVTDGKFDVNDAAFNSVRLWQDTNQDGVSQAAELHTFAELGVDSIFVAGTAGNLNLGGGNTQTFSGSFTRVGGTTGDAGTAELAGSLLLVNNNFYRQFTDDPVLTAEALNLPQMQGSGWVREWRSVRSRVLVGNVKSRGCYKFGGRFCSICKRYGRKQYVGNCKIGSLAHFIHSA